MGERARKIMQLAMHKRESDSNLTKYVTQGDVQVDFHDTQNENKVLEITPAPKLLDMSYNYVSAQDNANTVVPIAPSKPHDVETSTEANFRNEIEPQAVPDSYTTNVDDSPYVEEPFQDSGSSYAPSEEYGSDSTSDAMEKAPDEEQESSSVWAIVTYILIAFVIITIILDYYKRKLKKQTNGNKEETQEKGQEEEDINPQQQNPIKRPRFLI
ncbi:hypothetical protein FQA39_LY06479 [Lamprigera yunnana]|nr:hypothetical protein FQA39_LY06479 [Lamprigera yunnana]